MPEPFVFLSEPILTPLVVENGLMPVDGFHALAGLALQGRPLDPEAPFEWLAPEIWALHMARFWRAMAVGLQNGAGPWQTSFELRSGRNVDGNPLQTSLWVKTFAPQDVQADQAAAELATTLLALCPPACKAQPITAPEAFAHWWGSDIPQTLAEIRRPAHRPAMDETKNQARQPVIFPWHPTADSLRQVWALLQRLPAPLWLSVGICPTQLFKSEIQWLKQAGLSAAGDGQPLFLLRLRLGGMPMAVQCLAQALAAALTEPWMEAASTQAASSAANITPPDTAQTWDTARFNWRWGDFLPWGSEPAAALGRLPYLFDDVQTGLIAGVWC
jgi:hypothetical protein